MYRASLVAQLVKNQPVMQETPVLFLNLEDTLEKGQTTYSSILGLPWWLNWCRICLHCGNWVLSWVGKIPWRRTRQPTPVFLPGESHGQRSLAGYSLWGCKESDMTQQLSTAQSDSSWRVLSGYLCKSELVIYYYTKCKREMLKTGIS